MTEDETRAEIVRLAREWIGTPYHSNAMVKGRKGGVDCAMILVAVYADAGIVSKEFDPRPYPPHWHLHQDRERYMETVLQYAHEIPGPPKPGDVVLFKIARTFAHGAIVIDWPWVVHARAPGSVSLEDITTNNTGKHALALVERKFYSFWGD